MKNLDEKYDKNNWITWRELLSKYHGKEINNKCDSCQFAMSGICAATYYGKKLNKITVDQQSDCDYAIEFSSFVDLGEKRIDKEFTEYIYRG